MSRLEEVYRDLQTKKLRRKELQQLFKDELAASARYATLQEELKRLREEKKSIESDAKANALKDAQELDGLRADIQSDGELLADIALNLYLAKQPVEVMDEYNNRLVPFFRVTFKKG